jgi:hypothetical protein
MKKANSFLFAILIFPTVSWPAWCSQFITQGSQLLLNGQPITLHGDSWHFMGVPQMMCRYAYAWIQLLKDAGANAVRLQRQKMSRRRTMIPPATAERKGPTAVGSGELLGRRDSLIQLVILARFFKQCCADGCGDRHCNRNKCRNV